MSSHVRSTAKKAIGLFERGISSSKHILKQTNSPPGFVRNQQKAELPPDARATPEAAMPKPPLPSTGATSSASSSSSWSSLFASLRSRHSFLKHALILGAGAIGTGALLYSLSGNGDGGERPQERSIEKVDRPFFKRSEGEAVFKSNFNDEPGVITVLLGPPNCGKTRFLQDLEAQFDADDTAPPFLYIDSRYTPMRTPEEFSRAFFKAFSTEKIHKIEEYLGLSRFMSLLSSLKIKTKLAASNQFFQAGLEAELAKNLEKDEGNFELTLEKYKKILEASRSMPRKPVLVIDEANMLMKWKEPDSDQPKLEKLFAHLVSVSKQNKLAHVVLATSDYFLVNWLEGKGKLAMDNFEIEVLGVLREEEAREFVLGDGGKGGWAGIINEPSSLKPVPEGAEQNWPAIYARCGGNIGKLKHCVRAARSKGSWNSALDVVIAKPRLAIERGFDPERIPERDVDSLWTGEQWETVLQEIVKAPYHAVLREELAKKLGKGDGKIGNTIIVSMVKHNLLALRPYSTLARDLPPEVHGDLKKVVVTLPNPGYAWAAKELLLERKS